MAAITIDNLSPPYTLSAFLDRLFYILSIPTGYWNAAPYNCGYNHGTHYTFDCVCLIKAVMEGWNPTAVGPGDWVYPFTRTGDVNENGLINECTGQSGNFSNMQAAAVLCMYGQHIGCYVGGEFERNGKIYNTIECTPSYGAGVVASYVDSSGFRHEHKDAPADGGRWDAFGYMTPWLTYDTQFVDPGSITDPINPGGGSVTPPGWQSPNLFPKRKIKSWLIPRRRQQYYKRSFKR